MVALVLGLLLCGVCRVVKQFETIPKLVSENVQYMYDEGIIDMPKFDTAVDIPDKYIDPMNEHSGEWSINRSFRDIQFAVFVITVCGIVGIISLMLYINGVIADNYKTFEKLYVLRNILDEDERSEIENTFNMRQFKKKINLPLIIIVPLVATTCCCLAMNSIIQQYGIRVTGNISWIVQEYEIGKSEEAMDEFNTIDGVSSVIESRFHVVDFSDFKSIGVSSVSGYNIDKTIVTNHRSLHNGAIICVKMDLLNYYKLIMIQIAILVLYLIYVMIKLGENRRILIE